MAEHVPTIPTSRRSLLAAGPTAMVLAGAGIGGAVQAAAPNPDAELIAALVRGLTGRAAA